MSNIGLIVVMNYYVDNHGHRYFKSKTVNTICKDLEDAHTELINYLCSQFNNLNIDFPLDYNEFELIWFDRNYIEMPVFTYKLFSNNNWIEPWEYDDIYNDVLDKLLENDEKNPPNFEDLYGEPSADDSKNDKFQLDPNLDNGMREMEDKLEEILNQAKSEMHNYEKI